MIPRPKQTSKRQVSRTASIQAPTGGLNARDAIAAMKETDAVIMTNWFPSTSSVDMRKGFQSHATGITGNVESLMSYSYGATDKLWSIVDGDIIEVTASGAVGAAAITGLGNSRFEHILMGTSGGNFLMAVNGQDKLHLYNGTTWTPIDGASTPAITGVTTSTISNINSFKNRVFLIQKNTLKAWYLPVSSIAGAASALDFSDIFSLGGYLVTMTNWTLDSSVGIDDYAVFISSEGEVAIYQGTDPSSSTTWALKGTFRIGRPIGKRCVVKAGADVLILTTDGAFPLSKSLLTDRSQSQVAVTDKITKLITQDIASYGTNFGWQPIIFPTGNKLIINVPSSEGLTSHQYVMNTITGAWCKFTGLNAFCFETLGDKLYFGGVNGVFQAETDTNDNGSDITGEVQQSFSYFGDNTSQKHFKMVRPIFISETYINPLVTVNVDFGLKSPQGIPSYSPTNAALWDVALWDVSYWVQDDILIKDWRSVNGIGYCAGIRIKSSSAGYRMSWQSTDFVYERGGVI